MSKFEQGAFEENSSTTRAKIDQVDATLFVEQRLNNVVIKVQQHLLISQC